jgi:arylsulfatase A-like enzyme
LTSSIDRRDFLKLLALLPLAGAAPGLFANALPAAQATDKPNVLVLVFDALSATNMSLYGYPRNTTPNLARFAERSTVYNRHYADGPFTTPGTASLLTGALPWSHRALELYGTVTEPYLQNNFFHTFKAAGYHCYAYTHNLLAYTVLSQFNKDVELKLPRDLALSDEEYSDWAFPNDYDVAFTSERMMRRGETIGPGSLFLSVLDHLRLGNETARLQQEYRKEYPGAVPNAPRFYFLLETGIDWLQRALQTWPQPFMAYVHFKPPHAPYAPRADFVGRFDDGWEPVAKKPHPLGGPHGQKFLNEKRRAYDEFVAFADSEFGRLLNSMEGSGVLDKTYVVFTSDHGENFERGWTGHFAKPLLFEPGIRVPLIISQPGNKQRQDVNALTVAVDLLPTLARVAGTQPPPLCEGSILPTFDGSEVKSDRSIYVSGAKSNAKFAPLTRLTVTLIKGDHKLIYYLGYNGYDNRYELYNLKEDPEELKDLYQSRKKVAAGLQDELTAKLREVNQPYLHG